MASSKVERANEVSRVRVSKVTAESFRGVPGRLEVSFRNSNGKPSSALIFGDNGSGKSSIVDAIEWACQRAVGRNKSVRANAAPSLVNLAAGGTKCSVEVELSDGSSARRWATFNEVGVQVFGDQVPDAFARIPMSLKRADILRFLDTPAIKRGSIFIDHALGEDISSVPSLTTDQQAVIDERHETKRLMREAAADLAKLIGVDPPPRGANDIAEMISVDVYKRLPAADRIRVSLPRAVQAKMEEVNKHKDQVYELNQRAKRLRLPSTATTERLLAMQALLSEVGDWLTSAFLSVTGASHVRRVEPAFGQLSDVSLEINVTLAGEIFTTPQKVFSEGYQDLIALLYFLAVARAAGRQGQARVLILDDVLQSVDANIRVSLMEMVVREFKDWQLLVTVHDRLWRSQLRDIFQRTGHPVMEIEIRNWDFGGGPHVLSAGVDPADSLWAALDLSDPFVVCGVAGRLLEQICDHLSWTLPSSVKRKRGDAYTLHDMWPGIMKELKGTSCAHLLAKVDTWVHLRNAAGAHYNEWAEGVTWVEAESFGLAVLELYGQVRCDSCKQWVERAEGKRFACRCSGIRIEPLS
ncbi:AAA family ATPase [Streptomyces corynorhini]|uniref:AAA family ATPase n=1 Tax=Streptomyces corynorhini TaxID=2282652 RepID=UPI0013140EE7|nr:AAA family ATPase [Streptomyces corynorhini]